MSDELLVTDKAILNTAKLYKETYELLEEDAKKILDMANLLEGVWKGDAYNKFIDCVPKMLEDFKDSGEMIKGMSEELYNYAENMASVDKEQASLWDEITDAWNSFCGNDLESNDISDNPWNVDYKDAQLSDEELREKYCSDPYINELEEEQISDEELRRRAESGEMCVIFYQPGIKSGDKKHYLQEQALEQKQKYMEEYPDSVVVTVPINNAQEFKDKWINLNDKDKCIREVALDFHGSITGEEGTGYMKTITDAEKLKNGDVASESRILANKNVDDFDPLTDVCIQDLPHKKVNKVYFSSCNSGNPEVQNTATAMHEITNAKTIDACDEGDIYDYKTHKDMGGGSKPIYETNYDTTSQPVITSSGYHYPINKKQIGDTSQGTAYKYAEKNPDGTPVREYQGMVRFKEKNGVLQSGEKIED